VTRKDYEKFARVIEGMTIVGEPVIYSPQKDAYLAGAQQQVKFIAEEMCSIFAADIPRFDRSRFLKACGIEE
jgi:hypothetical protein